MRQVFKTAAYVGAGSRDGCGKGGLATRTALAGAVAAVATLGEAAALGRSPILLANTTPSEPPGLYLRTTQAPAIGRLIAFRTPQPGLAYVARALPILLRRPLLKAVAAGPGDAVCTRGDQLVLNGRRIAPVARRDRRGLALPHWAGCGVLGPNEFFVFSPRVPNSFDSRYYGPVSGSAVLGVYRALLTPTGGLA